MKRLNYAMVPALMLCFAFLYSACAPSPSMIATLTQLPFAATPPTTTPNPAAATRAIKTPVPKPSAVEVVGSHSTTTQSTPEISLATPTETITVPPACLSSATDKIVPNPELPQNYIGRHYADHKPPTGIKWLASGTLDTDHSSWVHVQVQNHDMYWVQKMVCRDTAGLPYWEIVDALTLPVQNAEAHEAVVDLCFYNEQEIPHAIAYGTYDPSMPAAPVVGKYAGWPLQVKGAWQMDDRFVPLKIQELTCIVQESQSTP